MIPGTKYDPFDPYAFGVRWYDRGGYDRALAYWKPLAEAGDCDAQAQLGRLYFEGKGVMRIGVRQTLLLFCGYQSLAPAFWPEIRGYILAVRSVTS